MKNVKMPQNVKEYFESGSKKVKEVIANEDYTLTVYFNNDEVRIYDMSGMLYGVFKVLQDKTKFKEVFIDEFGNIAWDVDKNIDSSINWNNRIDLCADSVYLESNPIEQ